MSKQRSWENEPSAKEEELKVEQKPFLWVWNALSRGVNENGNRYFWGCIQLESEERGKTTQQ